jgi:hypothetical protein
MPEKAANWADGGKTSQDNPVLLCRNHHRLVHEGGFGVQTGEDNTISFTAPDGQIIPAGSETRFRGNVFALIAENSRSGIWIDSETSIPKWPGE